MEEEGRNNEETSEEDEKRGREKGGKKGERGKGRGCGREGIEKEREIVVEVGRGEPREGAEGPLRRTIWPS